MRVRDWVRRLLGLPLERSQLPEVLGYLADDQGRRHEVHRGRLKHASLSEEQTRRVARLREVLADPYPMTMEGWVDGFLRDAHPESEIQILEACAAVYHQLTARARLSREEKKRLYSVLCIISSGGDDPGLTAVLPSGKGLPDLESIIGMYRQARAEGRRP